MKKYFNYAIIYLPKRIDGGMNMVEIKSAESVARETLKKVLENEITLVNIAIEKAKENVKTQAYLNQKLSGTTIELLESAGYTVNGNSDDADIVIEWEYAYNRISGNRDIVNELLEELEMKIEASDEDL